MVHGPAGFGRRKLVAGGLGLLSLAVNRALGQRSAYSDSSFAGGPITGPFRPYWESLKAYRYPEWFQDAKFGMWAPWSAVRSGARRLVCSRHVYAGQCAVQLPRQDLWAPLAVWL